ncbi:peptide/nickel transport system substrate-binding protein [Salibacterium salarium]|uniref:oligopeptide ABC transporter substrate-binding protein n=1 Tax=Salibacterium salarium TaxID=284579 RepID=UPI00277DD043|nr:oligopeptide ABC transporter substrate-binding protein [Salibacterium salarium]MDQ0298372.1 peptide/nickel transport system substrate-binding protein [Salibacterium salarium]
MKKVKSSRCWYLVILVLLVGITACSNDETKIDVEEELNDEKSDGESPESKDLVSIDDFSNLKNSGSDDIIDGGSMNVALTSDSAFEGTLNWSFYFGTHDAQILQWFDEALLEWGEDYVYNNNGAATYEVSDDNRTYTIEIRDDVNWHDGEPVKAEDLAYAYEVIGHPDYTGMRYGEDIANVEGMPEYHEGEADSISGIEIIDEKTIEVTFTEATPSIVTGGLWNYPLAKHIFEDIPIEEMESSGAVRENPIGFGPFKVENIVPGESVTLEKNKDYWRGEPNLDEVVLQVVGPNVVAEALRSGEIDYAPEFPTDQYTDNKDVSNLDYIATTDRAYTYIGFKLGEWDAAAGENVMNPDAKMADVNLRKAMAHAVDNQAVADNFYDGLRWAGTTLIPPSHPNYHDENNEGLQYDQEMANDILDEAGYMDVNDDGFREDPDGEEITIQFASMEGGDTAEPIAKYYIQAWEQVGLNVELLDGRLQEFNAFYDRVENDDEDIDVFQAAWGVGIDVDPGSLYGRTSPSNYSRYTSEKNDELINDGLSDEAFDLDYRSEVYNEWQQLMTEEVPVFPTLYRSVMSAANKRVTNISIGDGTEVYLNEIGITKEEPVLEE